jgi:thiol peroxidase
MIFSQGGEGMNLKTALICFTLVFAFLFGGCATLQPKPPVDSGSVQPGTSVARGGKALALLGTPISKGKPLPSVLLVDATTMKEVDLSQERGKVLFLSIVPSVDTKVCEAQTHFLGEEGGRLPAAIQRITISRDLPFAQKRFAEEAKLTDIRYLSDYKTGDFGRATGLLVDDLKLLARAVVIVDRQGVVQYIQVVPEITHLPDMEGAFEKAIALEKEK